MAERINHGVNFRKMTLVEYDLLPEIDPYTIYFLDDGTIRINGEIYGGKKEVYMFNSIYEFPVVGQEDTLYVDESDNMTYRWDSHNYKCVGSDWREIELIDANAKIV